MPLPGSTLLPSRINDSAAPDQETAEATERRPSVVADVPAELDLLRRVLAALPAGAGAFEPGGGARSAAALVRHIGGVLLLTRQILSQGATNVGAPEAPWPPSDGDLLPLISAVTSLIEDVEVAVGASTEASLGRPWRVLQGGREAGVYERRDALRRLGLNHLIHHRAQLVLYLRLMGAPFEGAYADAPASHSEAP